MKGDNRTGKLSGELYHSRKDSKIENYVPGTQHHVVAGSGFAEAALPLPHSLYFAVFDECGRPIDSLYLVHRKWFPVPFAVTAHRVSLFMQVSLFTAHC